MSDTESPPNSITYEVLICTYNGADYIAEQLHSILTQSPAPKRLFVSDDGSTDATLDIVDRIKSQTSIPITILQGPSKGIVANVFFGLNNTTADYVFLADQDDIWLENKIQSFAPHMHHSDQPHLIFSDAWVWDPATNNKQSFWSIDGLVPDNAKSPERLAFHNVVQGASSCINRALINTAVHDPRIIMHDWWFSLIASALGRISIVRQPTLLYRQHANNQVGSQATRKKEKKRLARRRVVATKTLQQALAFSDRYTDKLTIQKRHFFSYYAYSRRHGLISKCLFLVKYWPRHKNFRNTLSLWTILIFIQLPDTTA